MNTWILMGASHPKGGSFRYKIPGTPASVAATVEEYRDSGRLLPIESHGGSQFFVNPEHVVAVYAATEEEH